MDIFRDPILNVADAALYLAMPPSTLGDWKRTGTVHSAEAPVHGGPVLPFVAMVEAFVLDAIRRAGFRAGKIREAADGVRRFYGDRYALARPGLGTDGFEIFIKNDDEFLRAADRQQAIRETITNFHEFIQWEGEVPTRLRLRQFDNVILDPRFGWGRPIVEGPNVPVSAIMGLWHAREPIDVIAEEFGMCRADVERVIQDYDRSAAGVVA